MGFIASVVVFAADVGGGQGLMAVGCGRVVAAALVALILAGDGGVGCGQRTCR